MSPEEFHKHSKMIDKSVSWIQLKTNDIWGRYEQIDDCDSDECEQERAILRSEMYCYLDKLESEEKRIDQYEEMLHNKTGIK